MLTIGSTQYHVANLTLGLHHLALTNIQPESWVSLDYAKVATYTTLALSSFPTSVYVFARALYTRWLT
jgi:hypothetical protein